MAVAPAAGEPEDLSITGEAGRDQTVSAEAEPAATEETAAADTSEASGSVVIAVKTIDAPVEKPKKGWWRR